jgi:hypothetical protein
MKTLSLDETPGAERRLTSLRACRPFRKEYGQPWRLSAVILMADDLALETRAVFVAVRVSL